MTNKETKPPPTRGRASIERKSGTNPDPRQRTAMSTLHEEFRSAIKDGDDALRQHVDHEVAQIRMSHDAAEKLEIERVLRVEESLRAIISSLDHRIDENEDNTDECKELLRDHIKEQLLEIQVALATARRETGVALEASEKLEVERIQHVETQMHALLAALTSRVDNGEQRLREHIDAQHNQISAALESARRETGFAHDASEKAIAKAEAANEKRFEGVNEFREQLADQAATFLPREVAEAQFAEMRRSIAELADKLGKIT